MTDLSQVLPKSLIRWLEKNNRLESKIDQLLKSGDFTDHIASFLLSSQMLEFEMIQLLQSIRIDLHELGLLAKNKDREKLPKWYSDHKAVLNSLIRTDFEKYINLHSAINLK